MKKWINMVLLLTVAGVSLWCTGDLMRKNDQASILAGANDIAQGRAQTLDTYYQFDKTYVLYGTCAAILKGVPDGVSPVAAANVGLALIFWLALAVFVVRFRDALSPVVLLCFVCAPAVLLNTLYVNSSVLSSAFLLLSAVFLLREGPRGGWLAALFFFLAVGSRADVILLLPLLLWLITPFARVERVFHNFCNDGKKSLSAGLAGSKPWKLMGAGVAALVAGRWICRGGGTSFDPIFNAKMVAGYWVFGFGAAGILFILYAFRLAAQAARARSGLEKLYGLAGLAAFLLPVLFFIPQLHAPRYFWRGCEAVLLLAVAGRLPVWNFRWLKVAVCSAALLPMLIGVKLPELTRPRPTGTAPELFPSGDGFYPMGAYIPFLFRLRQAADRPLDHNQQVWAAVHSAQFDFSPEGTIDVLKTPMYGYFMFEASLRGGFARCRSFEELRGAPFYADSRSLMRDDPKSPFAALPKMLALPAHFVSPVAGGVGVLRFGGGDFRWGRQTALLNRLFAGNEYRLLDPGSRPSDSRQTACVSDVYFAGSEQDAVSGLYYAMDSEGSAPAASVCATTVLPRWMSMQAFKGSDR
jgi:hypothetical protein